MLRKLALGVTLSGLLVFAGATAAFADTTGGTGQPGQSCQVTTTTPGSAAGAPGSPFNPVGQAGNVYAGNAPQNSINPKSVSQYDVACFQQTTH
jgi:hypothetical protein